MSRSSTGRVQVIRTAATLFRRQGYAATGWRQIIAESGTPWGSQAHHFPGGKEQLGVEAIVQAGETYARTLRSALAGGDPAGAIELWSKVAAHELQRSGWADGCPIATVALETSHTSTPLAAACDAALTSWVSILIDAFVAAGMDSNDAKPLATLVLAAIEGSLLLARARRSSEPLFEAGTELAALIRQRIESQSQQPGSDAGTAASGVG